MELVLVSGLSGSGKSIALEVLEDSGYYCVDNLPATLLLDVVKFLNDGGQGRIAVSVDARSVALSSLPQHLAALKALGAQTKVLFLEASAAALLRRFSETRRSHPLAIAGLTLNEAIERERVLLAGVSELGHRIDTSDLQPKVLRNWIKDLLGPGGGSLTLLFESFAFRDGIPLDADWVVDARMLPNPHYEPGLASLTGRDAPVIEYLESQEKVGEFLEDLRAFLARWLPEARRDNRNYLTVAIGCTGGRHRSVYLAERLARAFAADWRVLVRHRGLAAAVAAADGG
ncbi:MAG: RNase adaptor protein RapZ [Betaproteobacteria bacterium RBG_16_66_20]|nr:MAG: RNase adaptor protein RapZ [Betaproteobacteria bacterium RBG_16_66_20]